MREDVLELLKNKDLKDRKIDALASALHYDSTEEYIAFVKLMNRLEEDGELIRDNQNNYHLIDDFHYLQECHFRSIVHKIRMLFAAMVISMAVFLH